MEPQGQRTAIVLAIALLATMLQSCASLFQTPDQALFRKPGDVTYGDPVPVSSEAARHWEFALLSVEAYAARERSEDSIEEASGPKTPKKPIPACGLAVARLLDDQGWVPWTDFPSHDLKAKFRAAHLRAEVWEHRRPLRVVVAFGGTVFTSRDDWMANLRWFLPTDEDEYTLVNKVLAQAFVEEFVKRVNHPDTAYLAQATLLATGHSLGAGLAQQFAYALPNNIQVPRVTAVYAFDPSPVTGYYSVEAKLREENASKLVIERVFEQGELLAALRSALSWFYPPSAEAPAVRTVRYDFAGINPLGNHSMLPLACNLFRVKGG